MPLSPIEQWRLNLRNRYATPYARGQKDSPTYQAKGGWNWGQIGQGYWPWEDPTDPKIAQERLFPTIQRNIIEPFAATVTAPFSPTVPGTEKMSWIERQKIEYEKWKSPWGVKGLVETLPYLAVPGAGGLAAKAGGLAARGGLAGAAGRAGIKALTPLARGEQVIGQAMGKSISAATKPITKPIAGAFKSLFKPMPELRPMNQIVEIASRPDTTRKLANLPGINRILKHLNPSGVAKTVAEKARVGRGIYELESSTKAAVTMSFLDRLGPSSKMFGLDDLNRIQTGPLKGVFLHDVATYPKKYLTKLNPTERNWVKEAIKIEDEIAPFLKRSGIEINELAFDEGGRWASRRVVAKVSSKGEILDVGFISPGPGRRMGSKTAMEKTRVFKSIEDATEAGYRYMPWEDSIRFNVAAAYNRVADKKMTDWVLERIPWRTTAAPQALKDAASIASQRLAKAKKLQLAINRAIRGEKLPEVTLKSFDELNIGIRGAANDVTALRGLKPKATEILEKARQEFHLAEGARARAREKAMRTTFEEATVPTPAFAGKILTGPDAKETAAVLREFSSPQINQALVAVNQMNAVGRAMALAGDVSPFGIQLIFLPFTNPKAYVSSMKGFIGGFFSREYQSNLFAKHANLISRHPDMVLTARGATEATEAMARGGWLSSTKELFPQGEALLKSLALLPVRGIGKTAGTVLKPFQRGYETALDTAGIKLAQSMEHIAKTPAQMAELDVFINEFRGLFSQARLGMSQNMRQAERVAILAPQYTRAVGAWLFDAARGTVGRGGLRGKLARDSLAKGVTGMMALTVAVSMMRGETIDETVDHLNPASNNFMTWDVAGQRVGPGSKVRSILRLIGRSIDNPEDIFELSMKNPALGFLRGNLAPVGGTSVDLLTGRDFIGDPTRDGMLSLSKTVLGENMVPIWLQSVAYEGGKIEERIFRGGIEFAGGRAYPEYVPTPEQIKWKAYREIEDKIWAGYPPEYRDIAKKANKLDKYGAKRLLMQYPGIVMAMKRIDKEKQRWLLQNRRVLQL